MSLCLKSLERHRVHTVESRFGGGRLVPKTRGDVEWELLKVLKKEG
jgi:hypothetical protein